VREHPEDFRVRGYHLSFYAIDLPLYAPESVVEKMVARFREHLRNQLNILRIPYAANEHSREQSFGSDMSGGSHGSLYESEGGSES